MLRKILIASFMLIANNAMAGATDIRCVKSPFLFVGNVRLQMSTASNTYEINYDDGFDGNKHVVAVSGTIYVKDKDSMGFDMIYLCTAEPCSGETFLGYIKAADQANGQFNDRTSYLSMNPFSNFPVKIKSLMNEYTLTGLSEWECNYN